MPISVIVGGQFGSEGKGKVAHHFAKEMNATAVVRVGGSNSGHTVIDSNGQPLIFRHLPTAAILPGVLCCLGAGSYLNVEVLLAEIEKVGLTEQRLIIDPLATVIGSEDQDEERRARLRERIGSTISGTGAAVLRRAARSDSIVLARDEPRLEPYVRPLLPALRGLLHQGQRIIIEGTQGFGLSLLHWKDYPYVTSRDTTAAGFLAEVGLSPLDVDDVIVVLRAFPIRVPGSSGPLPNETDWQTLTRISQSSVPIQEFTSVTQGRRRVAYFDEAVVREAICSNNPTRIVVNHLDYIDSSVRQTGIPSLMVTEFLSGIRRLIDTEIDYAGFSPAHLTRYSNS